jgi:hypothetical protein
MTRFCRVDLDLGSQLSHVEAEVVRVLHELRAPDVTWGLKSWKTDGRTEIVLPATTGAVLALSSLPPQLTSSAVANATQNFIKIALLRSSSIATQVRRKGKRF